MNFLRSLRFFAAMDGAHEETRPTFRVIIAQKTRLKSRPGSTIAFAC
jgi:hypothetical protein